MREQRTLATMVTVRRMAVSAFLLAGVMAARTALAAPVVVDFEDQPDSINFYVAFPSTYEGISWNNWVHYAPYGAPYQPGGVNAVFALGDAGTFTFSDRVFSGASFSLNPNAVAAGSIFFDLYKAGSQVWTSGSLITGPTTGPLTTLASGYGGVVDEVRVRVTGGLVGGLWIMDNVTFDMATNGPFPVPEPTSLALLAAGLVGLTRLTRGRERT